MHLCTAYIALGGDTDNVVFRGPYDPVSWPEIGLLQFLHGEENVYNAEVVSDVPTRPQAEKERLRVIYGDVVEQVYPGRAPMLEMEMPGAEVAKPTVAPKVPAGKSREPV